MVAATTVHNVGRHLRSAFAGEGEALAGFETRVRLQLLNHGLHDVYCDGARLEEVHVIDGVATVHGVSLHPNGAGVDERRAPAGVETRIRL